MIVVVGEDRADWLAARHAEAFDHPWNAEALRELLAAPGVFALADEAFTGFILVRVVAEEAEILTLAVAEPARRRGLGRRLLQASEAESAARGASILFLEVAADNDGAIALYASAGFQPIGRRRGYYARANGSTIDALLLNKPLQPAA
jgi:ribosomal-protein-alanine N-acetyltransferase